MAKKAPREGKSARGSEASEGTPVVPPVVFSRDPLDPRYYARPGTGSNMPAGTSSRAAMGFTYAVIIGMMGLIVLAITLNILHK